MSDTILPGIDGDLIDGTVGDDTLFATADSVNEYAGDRVSGLFADPDPPPDTETIIYDGKLWRRVIVGSLVVRIGETPRICIEYEPV